MVDGPVTNRCFSHGQVQSVLLFGTAILLVLLIAIGSWEFYSRSAERAAREHQQALEANAKQQATKMSGFFGQIAAQLRSLAKQKSLIALFEQDDESLRLQEAKKRIRQFESGLKLRLLRPGQYELDNDSNPPLSYASLDLLQQAEQSASRVNLAVVLFGGSQQHIILVQRVSNKDGELIGLLHLSLDVALFETAADTLGLKQAYAELQQPGRGKSLVLAKRGDTSLKKGEPISTGVTGTRWSMSYWQGDERIAGPAMPIALALAVLLVVVGVFIFWRRKPDQDGTAQTIDRGQKQGATAVAGGAELTKEEIKAAAEQDVFDITGS